VVSGKKILLRFLASGIDATARREGAGKFLFFFLAWFFDYMTIDHCHKTLLDARLRTAKVFKQALFLHLAGEARQRALASFDSERLELTLRATSTIYTPREPGLFSALATSLDHILLAAYPALALDTRRYVLCSHCLALGRTSAQAYRWPLETLVQLAAAGERRVKCEQGGMLVSIALVAPDLLLADDIATISASEVQEVRELGRGAKGQVFEIRWRGRVCALKRFIQDEDSAADSFADFKNEAEIQTTLKHPCLVQLLGVVPPPQPALLLELLPGGDLYHHMRAHQPAQWPWRLRIASDLSRAMRFLHANGILHRDLRSPNVFLTAIANPSEKLPLAKLGDFGLAIRTIGGQAAGVLETWMWAAPETWESRTEYSFAADGFVYCLLFT
jgi:hypothetical protein